MRGDDIATAVVQSSGGAASKPGQATAKQAVELLVSRHDFIQPSAEQRGNVAMAFAGAKKVVYGQAFDAVKLAEGPPIDLGDLSSVRRNLERVTLYEVKSTNRSLKQAASRGVM